MKQKVSPVVGILIVIVALAAIFGIMWWRSEAPVLNKLPTSSGMGPQPHTPPPGIAGNKASPAKKDTPQQKAGGAAERKSESQGEKQRKGAD